MATAGEGNKYINLPEVLTDLNPEPPRQELDSLPFIHTPNDTTNLTTLTTENKTTEQIENGTMASNNDLVDDDIVAMSNLVASSSSNPDHNAFAFSSEYRDFIGGAENENGSNVFPLGNGDDSSVIKVESTEGIPGGGNEQRGLSEMLKSAASASESAPNIVNIPSNNEADNDNDNVNNSAMMIDVKSNDSQSNELNWRKDLIPTSISTLTSSSISTFVVDETAPVTSAITTADGSDISKSPGDGLGVKLEEQHLKSTADGGGDDGERSKVSTEVESSQNPGQGQEPQDQMETSGEKFVL